MSVPRAVRRRKTRGLKSGAWAYSLLRMMIGSSRVRGLIVVMSATLDRYCVSCHSDRLKTGDLSLQGFDLSAVGEHSDTLEKVVRKLRLGSMPPLGRPRPDVDRYRTLI